MRLVLKVFDLCGQKRDIGVRRIVLDQQLAPGLNLFIGRAPGVFFKSSGRFSRPAFKEISDAAMLK